MPVHCNMAFRARLENTLSDCASLADGGGALHMSLPVKLAAFCPDEVFVYGSLHCSPITVLYDIDPVLIHSSSSADD